MIRHTLILLCLLFSISLFAQEEETSKKEKKPRHEVRLITENFFKEKLESDPYDLIISYSLHDGIESYKNYADLYAYGLGYNYNLNNIGFRFRGYYMASSSTNLEYYGMEANNEHNQYKLSFGINYQQQLDKLVMFAGIDFSLFQINASKLITSTYYNPQEIYHKTDVTVKYEGKGIEPVIGLKYFILKNFSISSEMRIMFDSFNGQITEVTTTNSPGGSNENYKSDFKGFDNRIGPKGSISLNVHF